MKFMLTFAVILTLALREAWCAILTCYECDDCSTASNSPITCGENTDDQKCEVFVTSAGVTNRKCCDGTEAGTLVPLCQSDPSHLLRETCTSAGCNNKDTSPLQCLGCSGGSDCNTAGAATACSNWSPTHHCQTISNAGTTDRKCCETDDKTALDACDTNATDVFVSLCNIDSCNDMKTTPLSCYVCDGSAKDCDIAAPGDIVTCERWSPSQMCETMVNTYGHTTRRCCETEEYSSKLTACISDSSAYLYHKTCSDPNSGCNDENTASYVPLRCYQCTNVDNGCDTLTAATAATVCLPGSTNQKCETYYNSDGSFTRRCCESSDSTALPGCKTDGSSILEESCAEDSCNERSVAKLNCYQCDDCKTVEGKAATECDAFSATQKCETYVSNTDGLTKRGCCETDPKTSLAECTADTSDQCDTDSCNNKEKEKSSAKDINKVFTSFTFVLAAFSIWNSF